jgi:gamma-glutamyltranspeptidase/glutathione hydrolase
VGGTTLAALLLACGDLEGPRWNRESRRRLIAAQRSVLDFRRQHLDLAADVAAAAAPLLDAARSGRLPGRYTSAATVHTSAVDADGIACAVTASSGYGSGEMAPGTGIWLNNCLGELELNRRGLDAGPPGTRLPSNMSPSVARHGDTVLAVGSPGADRITTALHQFFVNYIQFEMPLADAIAEPRVHVDTSGDAERLMAEPGARLPSLDLPVRVTDDISMYFGGVGAALFDRRSGFEVAADPRREGGTIISDA